MGKLFTTHNSEYIKNLKNAFIEIYDDRFVTLKELFGNRKMKYHLLSPFQKDSKISWDVSLTENQIFTELMRNGATPLDLSSIIPHRKIDHGGTLSLLFKRAKENQIYLEQASSKSPLSITGRFSFERVIYNYNLHEFESLLSRHPVVYFDFDLLETENIHALTYHKNVTGNVLNFNGGYSSDKIFSWENIYIGIYNGSFKLFDPIRDIELKPLVQNAANPRKIKTPWGRLLYEIGFEDGIQLDPLFQKISMSFDYSPQLNWNNLILKPKTWIYKNFKSGKEAKKHAKDFLEEHNLPSRLLVGFADQELVLNRYNADDLEILLKRIDRKTKSPD